MRMQYFKNPADGSESDELDELVDEVDELGMPMVVVPMPIDFEDDNRSILNSDNDIETDNSDESEFDPYAADSDDSMSDVEAENSGADTNADEAGPSGSAGGDTKGGSGEAGGSADGRVSGEGRSSGSVGGEGAADSDDDSDDDETVRKIKENIKKPRNAPPQIELEEFIMDICMHSERNIIAIATISGDVLLYQYTNEGNTLLRTVEAHAKACRDVEFSYDGNDLITCSKDKSIMIHDVETEKLKKFYETAHDEPIDQLYVMDEFMVASGDEGGTVKLWDLRTKEPVFALHEVDDYITKIISNNAKKLLLFTSGDGYLTTVNIGARKLYVQSEPYEEELSCMELYRGDSKLVVGTSQGRLYSYNWGQFGYHCDMYPGIKTPIGSMVPLTDRSCVVAGEEGIIRACHITPYRNLGIVGQHDSPIEALDIDSTGEILASASHNYEVRFWNVKYFEDFDLVKNHEKHNAYNDKRHNLPSSKFSNATDFFSDLAGEPNQEGEN